MTATAVNPASRIGSPSVAPWLSRLVMIPPALIMIVIGLRYIGNPVHAASHTGVALSTPEALTDTRVVGALAVTLAFVIVTSAFSLRTLRMGQATVIVLMGLILAVRMFGFIQDGTTLATGDQRVKTIGEVVFLTLNATAFILQTYLSKRAAVSP